MIVPGMFVCSSFLISVSMFIVSKALFISSATVIVHAGGAIWLNPFVTVLFSVCGAVTAVLYNLPKNNILRLQRIQNQVAWILTKTQRCDHITEVPIDLH